MFYKALLLLPAVACARHIIHAEIKKHSDSNDAPLFSLHVWNNITIDDIISDKEQQTWQITKDRLKDMVQICPWTPEKGGVITPPDFVVVKNPSPSVVFQTQNRREVRRIIKLRPWDDRDQNLTKHNFYSSNPTMFDTVKLASEKIYNDKNYTVKYTVGRFKESVEETVSSNWYTDGELTVNDDVGFEFVRNWDLSDMSFSGPWGKNVKMSKTATVATGSGVTVDLAPGEAADVDLTASRGTLEIKLQFKAFLSGDVLDMKKLPPPYSLEFHSYDVNYLLHGCHMRKEIWTKLTINIVFYVDPHLSVSKRINF